MRNAAAWGIHHHAATAGIMQGNGAGLYDSLRSGLVAQWKLNEASGNALDSVGSYNITQNGTSGSAAGKISNCRTFDGSCNFSLNVSASLAPAMVGVSLSGSTWFYLGGAAGARGIFSVRNAGGADGNIYILIRMEGSSLVSYCGTGNSNNFTSSTRAAGLSLTTWYHYAWSFTIGTKAWRDSINGGAVGTFTSTYAPLGSPTGTPSLAIGGEATELFMNTSRIDCTKLWVGRALSDADLLLDYNAGAGVEL